MGERHRGTDETTRERAECAGENGEAVLGGCPMDVWVCKRAGVEVGSGEAVCEVGLGCGEDVDDEVCGRGRG